MGMEEKRKQFKNYWEIYWKQNHDWDWFNVNEEEEAIKGGSRVFGLSY